MEHIGTQTIETERLVLRRFQKGDEKQMFKNYTSSDKVTEFLTWQTHKQESDTKGYLECVVLPEYEKQSTYRWAIELKEIGEVIGCIDVVEQNDRKKCAELGWVIGDNFWGKGIMPEAGKVVLDVLFGVGYVRIQAIHHHANTKSGRVMEKLGMKHEGCLAKCNLDKYGNLVDCDIYAIIKGE